MNALFLSTGNAARSIIAEAVLNHIGGGWLRGFSAGSDPLPQVEPHVIALLERNRLPTAGLRPKSWDEFTVPEAPEMDFIFTLCDDVAEQACPVLPGQPATAHWSVPDPSKIQGDEMQKVEAYRDALRLLERRIELFTLLPFASLDRLSLHHHLTQIGSHT